MSTAAESQETMRRFGLAMQRMIRSPSIQARIRRDYETRMAELPWWKFRERRDLTRKYRMLTGPVK